MMKQEEIIEKARKLSPELMKQARYNDRDDSLEPWIESIIKYSREEAISSERARMRRVVEDFKNTLEFIKAKNPYPEEIFPEVEITAENFEKRRDAMFGTHARNVWRNCVERVEEELDAHLYQVGDKE